MCLKIRSPAPVFLRNKQGSLFENTFSRLSCIYLAICLKIRSPAQVSLNKPAICLFVNSFSPNYWRKRMRSVRARQTDAAGGKYVLLLCIHSTPIQSIQTHRSFNSFNYSTFIECFLLAVAQPTEASWKFQQIIFSKNWKNTVLVKVNEVFSCVTWIGSLHYCSNTEHCGVDPDLFRRIRNRNRQWKMAESNDYMTLYPFFRIGSAKLDIYRLFS